MSASTPALPTPRQQRTIALYFSLLFVGIGMHTPTGLSSLPVQFYLKDRLHLNSQTVAFFGLITAIPLYLSVLFGLMRDRWQPKRMGDRGYLLLGGGGLIVVYLGMALFEPTWWMLLIGTLLLALFFLVSFTASNSLTALVGQQKLMTGRLSALSNFIGTVPIVINFLAGGTLASNWSLRNVFLLMAVIATSLCIQAFWHSRDIFSETAVAPTPKQSNPPDLKQLLQHRGALVAALIWIMWNFAPGMTTATMYYLTDTVHLTEKEYGVYNAINAIAFCPAYAFYGVLCRRFTLRSLLFWGTVIGVPQAVPLLFTHSASSAMVTATLMGLMGGVATAAYYDLLIRACPKGLEGTLMMVATTGFWVLGKGGDLLGSWLYDHWRYLPCVVATCTVYALILPVLLLLPRTITEDTEEESRHRQEEYEATVT